MGRFLIAALAILFSVSLTHAGPLHDAANKGDVERVRELIAAGEDVNESIEYAGTPLHKAARRGHLEVVELLLAAGAKVDEKEPTQGWTPLHMAALKGSASVAALLIANGAEIDAPDRYERTPLHAAAGAGYGAVIEFLTASGADVNARNFRNHTPAHAAGEADFFDIVDLLYKLGTVTPPVEPVSQLLNSANPIEGKTEFVQCRACHSIDKGGQHKIGPNLWGVLEREKASNEKFRYTGALARLEGKWTYEELNAFLAGPADFAPGTMMTMPNFKGETDAAKRANLISYLRENGDDPPPLPRE